jgi:hypothetical protein
MWLMPPALLCLSVITVHISLTSNLPPTSQHQYSIPAAEQGPQLADDMLGLQMLCPSSHKIVVHCPHQSLPPVPLLISPADPVPTPFPRMQPVPNKCKIASNASTICP